MNEQIDKRVIGLIMMKPWQISLNKHPTKGEKKNEERGPKFEL
jgi:hypothetical protein